MKYILPYLRPYRRQTALAMVLVAFATVCDLLLPTIMNDILNHGVRQSDFAYIVRCCVWMLAVAAAGLAALLAGRKISCDVVAGFNADLRTDVFSLVNNMTFEEFNAIGAAALLSRSTYDIGTVSWVASMISGSLITIPVLFFGGVILALRKDVTMSLILLLFVPAIFLIVRPISKRIGPLHETSDKYIDIQNDVMRERLHGIRVIRAFNKEASLQQKIADATHVMAENIINANVQMGLLSPAAVLLVNLAVALLACFGCKAQPHEEDCQQDQHHGRDERTIRNGAAGLTGALEAHAVQQACCKAPHCQPVPNARFDSHADSPFSTVGKNSSPISPCGISSALQMSAISALVQGCFPFIRLLIVSVPMPIAFAIS